MTLICHYFVIYKQPYTNQEYCFLFEQKILIFIDFREISIFLIILTFYIRIQGEIVPFQGPSKILNVNKMAVLGWIALNLGLSSISIIKICKKNFFFVQKFFFGPVGGQNRKKLRFLPKNQKITKNLSSSSKMVILTPKFGKMKFPNK